MTHFSPLTEHQQVVFWIELLVILGVARTLGLGASRLGQPVVVGELAAGIALGPSVLGKVWPGGFAWLFPADKVQSGAVTAIGWVGVAFLLVLTGFETDLQIVRRLGRPAGSVAAGALLLPLGCGLVVGAVMPAAFMGSRAHRPVFVLFMGVALSISSLPVIAKILGDLGFMRRNFGQMTVAVGMVNDLVGWLALGVISGLATSGFSPWRLATSVAAMAVLLGGGLTLGQRAVNSVLRAVRSRSEDVGESLVAVVLIVLAVAAVAQAAGVEAVLGAYVAGIVLGRSRFRHDDVHHHLESMTFGALAPVFFATAGLRLDLGSLAHPTTAAWGGVMLVVAVATKFAGAYGGGRLARLPRREALALGSALNARGAVEVVIATVGLTLGVLSRTAFTAVVLMAIVTSMMAPPLLRLVVRNWSGTREEQERLQREELLDRNLLVRTKRLLLPSRGGANSLAAARVLDGAWPSEVGVTVLSVGDSGGEPDLGPIRAVFAGRDMDVRHVADDSALESVVAESKLGYQAIAVGAGDDDGGVRLLSPVVDDLLAASPIPLVIVRSAPGPARPDPPVHRCVLVPVAGTPASQVAQEIAFNFGSRLGTRVVVTHVVNRPEPVGARAGRQAGDAVLDRAGGMARQFGVEAEPDTRFGPSTGEQILEAAREAGADLIVIGANVRRAEGRPFLGHNVEYVLEAADTTVVVVTLPEV